MEQLFRILSPEFSYTETKGPKRARIAVARKLAILLHRIWQSETEFCWN